MDLRKSPSGLHSVHIAAPLLWAGRSRSRFPAGLEVKKPTGLGAIRRPPQMPPPIELQDCGNFERRRHPSGGGSRQMGTSQDHASPFRRFPRQPHESIPTAFLGYSQTAANVRPPGCLRRRRSRSTSGASSSGWINFHRAPPKGGTSGRSLDASGREPFRLVVRLIVCREAALQIYSQWWYSCPARGNGRVCYDTAPVTPRIFHGVLQRRR